MSSFWEGILPKRLYSPSATPPSHSAVQNIAETPGQKAKRMREQRNVNHKANRKHPHFVKGIGIVPPDSEFSGAGDDDSHATHQEVEGDVPSSRLGYLWSMLDYSGATYFRATGHEASAATEHGTASIADDVEGTLDQMSTVDDEGQGSTDTSDVDAAESEARESDTVAAEVDQADIDVDTDSDASDTEFDTASEGAAAAAKTDVEDKAKATNDAQHTNESETTDEQTQDQHALDQFKHPSVQVGDPHDQSRLSEEVRATFQRLRSLSLSSIVERPLASRHQTPMNKLASTNLGRPELLCPTFPPALIGLKESDFANIHQSEDLVRLSCVTLADLLWRTVIFANYFSDGSPTEAGLPRNFQFMPLGQQRFGIMVRESKSLGGRRPVLVPDHQAKVERDVLKFLSRVRQQPMVHIDELTLSNRDMNLQLQAHLRNRKVAARKELFGMFTQSYERRYERHDLDISAKGLDHLFDRTGSFEYAD
jgi:hypothetical protein